MKASSRRTFITRTLAAAAGTAAATTSWSGPHGQAGPAVARRYPLKLGLASYSTRKLTLEQTLELCREIALRHIHIKDVHLPVADSPEAAAAARAKIQAAGIELMGGGTITLKNDPAQVRSMFEYARRAGFPLIVAAPEPAAFDTIEAMIEEFDIRVAVHNHGPEDKFFPAPQDALRLLQGRDKRFGVCMDIGHAVRAGADPVKSVDDCGERLLDLHVKDLRDKKDKDSQVEVGRGALDIPGLLRALVKARFAGHVALEYEINAESPQVGIKESIAYLRGVMDTLA